jgi:hypothetical protein
LFVEAQLRGPLVVRVDGSAVAIRRASRMLTQNIPVCKLLARPIA